MFRYILILLPCIAFGQYHAPYVAVNADTKAGIFKDMDDKGSKRGVCVFMTRPCDTEPTKTMSAMPGRCNEADPPLTIYQIQPSTECALKKNNAQDSTQLRILVDLPEHLITFMENTKASFDTDSIKVAQKWKLTLENGWTQDDKDKFKIRGIVEGEASGVFRVEAKVCSNCP